MFDSIRRRAPVLFTVFTALGLPLLTEAQEGPGPFANNLIVEGSLPEATRLELRDLEQRSEPLTLTLEGGRLQSGLALEPGKARRLELRGTNADGKLIYHGEVELDVNAEFVPSVAVELKSRLDGNSGELSFASHRLDIEFAGVEREGSLYTRVTATVFDANGALVEPGKGDLQWGFDDPRIHEHLLECPVSHGGTSLCAEFLPEKFRNPVQLDACFRGKICIGVPSPPIPPVWRKVAVGMGGHACALKLNGELYCWGQGESGQLGYVAPKACTVGGAAGNLWGCSGFASLVACASGPCNFVDVTAGVRHTCAIDTNQDAWCWGENYDGQLGLNFFDSTHQGSPLPRAVVGGHKFKSIQAGFHVTCGLTTTNQVYCWGKNRLTGVLPADQVGWANDPRLVPTPEPIADLDLSWTQVCGRVSNGHLYCWGSNFGGALGSLAFPTAPDCAHCPAFPLLMQANIPALANQQVSIASAGAEGICAHLASGATPCWGRVLPGYPSGRSLDRLSRGSHHYCALSRGAMECAGMEALGDGSEFHAAPGIGPVRVDPKLNFRELDTGKGATCAIAADEQVYCWGSSTFAQLGLGSPGATVTRPVALVFPSTLKIPPLQWWKP